MNHAQSAYNARLAEVRARIAHACGQAGRSPESVKLLPVTKNHEAAVIRWVAESGLAAVGENRVNEAASKRQQADASVKWVCIGHLQTNKVNLALETFDAIHSVDRIKLVQQLDKRIDPAERPPLPILLQINAGKDPAKYGAPLEEADALLEAALAANHLEVQGLMTIAPLDENPVVARRCFERLRTLRDDWEQRYRIALPELSMGMSGDMEAAIEAGSTCIRIGTALFGERTYL